jgi:NAD(P)-dependent dehydrogenase (short-subunit alcohol dehydrogenase family)
MKLEGKVALITGSGNGIGKAMALLFAKEGADIAVNDIDLPSAEETAEEVKQIGRNATAIAADVGEPADVDMMVDRIVGQMGGVHILINNAAVAHEIVPTIESSVENWDKVIRVFLRGTYLCCRKVGQWMVSHRTGKVVNMSSIAGIVGFAPRPAYAPAKAAVIHLTRCLAIEWAKYGITVNCIAPGLVMTDRVKEQIRKGQMDLERRLRRIPLGRVQEPEDIARAALFLVSDDAKQITGVTLPVDGGWTAYGME